MKKAVIFDMDGLMIDSERVTYNEYVKKLEQLGHFDFTEELYKNCLGKNKQGICQVFIDHYGDDFPMDEVWDDVHVWIDESLRAYVPKKKGLEELLKYLKDNQYKTIVATSSGRTRVDEILKNANLTEYFDDSICGDEVTHGKPHPEIFLTACQKLGVTPQEALVLEDSEAGIVAAYDGHIDVICVPDMKYPEPQFVEKVTKIVDSLDQVIDYLKDDIIDD
ncbi:HAD family phosphatase [Allocoprobacillus halotolerans]|uniref:HAD family phosphatase n=1 Tax=Allocoprobacillus halotolerans TaxID=2944914 RepID=A0ABY5I888_9FIRM|nr:HAD family phosphatase [Allocoprobacillus halotolerans]UTY40604.1 HAD family phosphatase [Allocoprobacillus halotolerans]